MSLTQTRYPSDEPNTVISVIHASPTLASMSSEELAQYDEKKHSLKETVVLPESQLVNITILSRVYWTNAIYSRSTALSRAMPKGNAKLFIRGRCNVFLGGLCGDLIQAKSHLERARQECRQLQTSLSLSDEEKAMVKVYARIAHEA